MGNGVVSERVVGNGVVSERLVAQVTQETLSWRFCRHLALARNEIRRLTFALESETTETWR